MSGASIPKDEDHRLSRAPRPASAFPLPSQSLADEDKPERTAVGTMNRPQLSSIFVFVAVRLPECERTGVEQVTEARFCPLAELSLIVAAWRAQFGRVDIGDADLGPIKPNGVAVDNACPGDLGAV